MVESNEEEEQRLDAQKEVWTTENDSNGNEMNLSRVSTASAANRKTTNKIHPNLVGVQSRFRRKYFHKTIFLVLTIVIVLLLITIIIMAVYYRYFEATCQTKDCLRAAANLLQSMDRKVDPCEDFYKFTCGNWAEEHPKPDSSNSYDWFNEKQGKVLRKIREFLQSNITKAEPTAVAQTKTMYRACMDTETMEKMGLQPVTDFLKKGHLPTTPTILNITDNSFVSYLNYSFDWVESIAILKKHFSSDLIIGFDIFPDPSNRSIKRIVVGTPEPDNILPFKTKYEQILAKAHKKQILDQEGDDDENSETINAYSQYITEVMSAMVFFDNPTMNLEKHLPNMRKATESIVKITKILYESLKKPFETKLCIRNQTLVSTDENVYRDQGKVKEVKRKSTWIWIYDNDAGWDIEMVVRHGMADESNKS